MASSDSTKLSVLFVCIGNSCRSPMAEAIFKTKLEHEQINVFVDSAGLASWNVGRTPEPRCLRVLEENEISTEHLGRQICFQDFYEFDYIFGMDYSNIRDLGDMVPNDAKADVRLLSEFDPENEGIIRDPYFDPDDKGFRHIFVQISRCLDGFITHIKKTHVK